MFVVSSPRSQLVDQEVIKVFLTSGGFSMVGW